ncbi:MAG: ABC transporter ATP-binding protein [Gemmatimonadales bacterium]|nr:MAG: ABC transporter ATP-binding protein [Gemmatimonadales bacterium]
MTPPHGSGSRSKRPIDKAAVWKETRALLWTHRRSLAIGFVLMLVNRFSGFVLPASSKYLIDEVAGNARGDLLLPLAAAIALATLVQGVSAYGLARVVSVAAQRAIADMRRRVQNHVIHLPVSYFDSTRSGVLISRIMTDADGIRNLVGTGIVQLVGGILTASVALVVLFWLNAPLTLMVLCILAIFAGTMAYAFNRLRPIFRQRGEINAQVTGRLGEGLGGIRVVKTYVSERREARIFTLGVHRLFRNIASTITGTSAVTAFSTICVGAVGAVIVLVGGRALLAGTMTLGELVMYVFFVGLMAAPLVQMANIGTQISEAFAGLDRIREILSMTGEDEGDAERSAVPSLEGRVVLDGVGFSYDKGVPVLEDISLDAPAGTTTALVGPSGAGKSTLIGLIMAFHHPTKGRILVDGMDLRTVRLGDYRRQLGVVLQDNVLFEGTIGENIAFARPGASREEVREAARVANCDEFIDRFDKGYDTLVGERGVKLSGGQRQRVAIARAILADPRILILDEATSSLDSESEAMIQEGLTRLREGRTTFVIAHRLSTIRSADCILAMEGGRIVERGTHHELMEVGGLYRRLYERQHGIMTNLFVNPGEELTPVSADS